jgi:hypothetical protein
MLQHTHHNRYKLQQQMNVSALSFSIGIAFASTAFPVFTEIKPPASIMRSNEERSTIRSFITGKAFARHGSTTSVSPSLYARMCNWQTVLFCHGPCGFTIDIHRTCSANAFAAIMIKCNRILSLLRSGVHSDIKHFKKTHFA